MELPKFAYRDGTSASAPMGYEVTGQAPLDPRTILKTHDALSQQVIDVFPERNVYDGMPVIVISGKSGNPELWVLKDSQTYLATNNATDRLNCWIQLANIENEEVTARAINALVTVLGSSSYNNDNAIEYTPSKNTIISGATSFSSADNILANKIGQLDTSIKNIQNGLEDVTVSVSYDIIDAGTW